MEMRVTKLEKEHLLEAAGLAAENFRALRLAHPLLPRRYEDPDQILGMLEEMSETGSGAAALEGGRLVGFMRSVTIADFMGNARLIARSGRSQQSLASNRWIEGGFTKNFTAKSRRIGLQRSLDCMPSA